MTKFFLTTPIYYPNARPHVGSAYTTIVCDVLARYKRMGGYDVAFLTGTDEHGEKLERAAVAAGKSPREFVTEKRKLFLELWQKLGTEHTHFVYTDQPDHVTSVQRMLLRARARGYIDKRRYEGRYCVHDERYISDNSEPADCDICGRPAELISEENYFFKLSAFQDRLLEHYQNHPEFVQPHYRLNEVVSFVKSGLRDISVSRRRIKWGIPWPDDPAQVFYVWYDALTSYLTGIGFAQGEKGGPDFQKYWMDPEGEVVHMIGKDILRFHAVYWPAFLLAAGLPLPTTIFAHGWIYYEQDKMSKSKGNVVYPEPIVDALESFGAPGNDALRYYLLREAPFGQDMSFSYDGLIQRFNSDLANDLGNLVNRTITMLAQYCGGTIPAPVSLTKQEGIVGLIARYRAAFDRFDFSAALSAVWGLVAEANKLIVETKPWDLAKSVATSDQEKLKDTLYTVAESLRVISVLLYPVMPSSAQRVWKQLGQNGRLENERIDDGLKSRRLAAGTYVGKPEPIFLRLDKAATLQKLEALAETDRNRDQPKEALKSVQTESGKTPDAAPAPASESPTPSPQPLAPSPEKISIEDFAKVDMRVGQVVAAERVPGAHKLLKLNVDIGAEVRQVVAGIAEAYAPEQLVGMKVVIVTNLQPRKLRGVESNGMIVAASVDPRGKPVLVTFKEEVPNGARLK